MQSMPLDIGTTGRAGARLGLLVLHDDAAREYAYGPAQGLLDTRVGTFTQALYDEAVHGALAEARSSACGRPRIATSFSSGAES